MDSALTPAPGRPVSERTGVYGRHLRLGRPLLDNSARRWGGAVLACCAAIVALLGAVFWHQTTADWLDRAIDAPFLTWFAGHHGLGLWLASAAKPVSAAVLSAAVVVTCLLTGRLNGALLGLAAIPAAAGLDEVLLKPLIHRTYHGSLVYPSGHTTAMFALAATVTVLLLVPPHPASFRAVRIGVPAAACLLGVAVAVAVIGLGWHYFTDTVAGAAVGVGTVCALALVLDLPAVRQALGGRARRGRDTADHEL
jgi:membrane-associated phospholipid phosphatase